MKSEHKIGNDLVSDPICVFDKDDIAKIDKNSLWKACAIRSVVPTNTKEYIKYLYSNFEILSEEEFNDIGYESDHFQFIKERYFKYKEYLIYEEGRKNTAALVLFYKILDDDFLKFKEKLIADIKNFILPPQPKQKRMPSVGLLTMFDGQFEIQEGEITPENIALSDFQQEIQPKLHNVVSKVQNKKRELRYYMESQAQAKQHSLNF